jgi:hypothetical protein
VSGQEAREFLRIRPFNQINAVVTNNKTQFTTKPAMPADIQQTTNNKQQTTHNLQAKFPKLSIM